MLKEMMKKAIHRLMSALASTCIITAAFVIGDMISVMLAPSAGIHPNLIQDTWSSVGWALYALAIILVIGTPISIFIVWLTKDVAGIVARLTVSMMLHAVSGVLLGIPLYGDGGTVVLIVFGAAALVYGAAFELSRIWKPVRITTIVLSGIYIAALLLALLSS